MDHVHDKHWQLPLRFLFSLARVFQNLPAPPEHYGVVDVFADFQSFLVTWKLGVALSNVHRLTAPQGKQNLPKICQVRRVPFTFASSPLFERVEQAIQGSITPSLSLLRENRESCPGGTLGISGWGCAAGTLESLAYTRASSAESCYPILE